MTASPTRRVRWFLLACCVVLVLEAATHAAAMLFSPDPKAPEQVALLKMMRTVKVDLPGARRTMDDIDTGFGWLMCAACVGLAFIGGMFALGGHAPREVRRVTLGIAGTLVLFTLISVVYFFIIPTSFFGVALALAVASLLFDTRAGRAPL